MQKLIKQLKSFPLLMTAKPATLEQIIHTQQDLKINKIANFPKEFSQFLQQINTIEYDGIFIFGINPRSYYLDIFAQNDMLDLPNKSEIIILGYDEFEYLAYNEKKQLYQIIDKETLDVLQTYTNLSLAIQYLLKIEDE